MQKRGNPKRSFGYIRKNQVAKIGVSGLKTPEGTSKENDRQSAEILMDFFQQVYTKEDDRLEQVIECEEGIQDFKVSVETLPLLLNGLKPDKSPGPDGLHPMYMKEVVDEIATPLAMIFNRALETGELPIDWRTANVVPIFKKGSKTDPGNYRPLSLTTVVCKIMERLLRDHSLMYVNSYLAEQTAWI